MDRDVSILEGPIGRRVCRSVWWYQGRWLWAVGREQPDGKWRTIGSEWPGQSRARDRAQALRLAGVR